MGTQFMAWSFFAWFVGAVLGVLFEGATMEAAESQFSALLHLDVITEQNISLGFMTATYPWPNTSFLTQLVDAGTYSSAMWEGWATYVKTFLLSAMSFAFFVPLLLSLFGAVLNRVR